MFKFGSLNRTSPLAPKYQQGNQPFPVKKKTKKPLRNKSTGIKKRIFNQQLQGTTKNPSSRQLTESGIGCGKGLLVPSKLS